MKVLVDTSVWSLALRRQVRVRHPAVDELRALIEEGRVAMIGPIRQELLSGIRDPASFERLRRELAAFRTNRSRPPTSSAPPSTSTPAARRGVQGSNTDFLICASAERRQLPILTTDADFSRYAGILPIVLHGRV